MAVINQEPRLQPTPTQTHPRRRWRVPILIAAALATTAAASWVIFNDPSQSTTLGCHAPDDGIAIVDAASGDPVADCAAVWRRDYGSEPPPLVAYDNGRGGIEVVAAGADIPSDWVKLEPGQAQDVALIELAEALDDVGTGLGSGCYTAGDATAIVDRELDRLSLPLWTVRVDREPDGQSTCAHSYLDPEQQQVVLVGLDTGPPLESAVELATQLNSALHSTCMNLDQAAATAIGIAADMGSEEALDLQSVSDDAASCTRAHTIVGGGIRVVLRGPSA